jgi:hypothetical protein
LLTWILGASSALTWFLPKWFLPNWFLPIWFLLVGAAAGLSRPRRSLSCGLLAGWSGLAFSGFRSRPFFWGTFTVARVAVFGFLRCRLSRGQRTVDTDFFQYVVQFAAKTSNRVASRVPLHRILDLAMQTRCLSLQLLKFRVAVRATSVRISIPSLSVPACFSLVSGPRVLFGTTL